MGSSKSWRHLLKWLTCFLFILGVTAEAVAQNRGSQDNENGGNPSEGASQAKNQRWVKEETDILYAFPMDTKVGVGLSNPAKAFEVAGETRLHGQVGLDSNLLLQGDLQFSNSIWTSDGFLGIGTTDPQYNLDLVGTSRFDGNAQFLQSVQYDGETFFNENASFDAAVNFPGSGTWKANGQVGIGTTTPAYMLEVAGTSRFREKALFGSDAEFSGTVAAKKQLQVEGATSLSGDATLGSSLIVLGSSSFEGAADFVNKLTLPQGIWTTEGRLGIGTTAPGSMLEVAGTMAVQGAAEFANSSSFAGNVNVGNQFTVNGSSQFISDATFDGLATFNKDVGFKGAANFESNVGFSGPINLPGQSAWTADGNVGIGTETPTSKLDVAGSARFGGATHFESAGNFAGGATVQEQLSVEGTSSFTQQAQFNAGVTMSRGLSVGGAADIGNKLTVTGNTVIEGSGNIKGEATLDSSLAVSGPSTFLGNSEFNSDISVEGVTQFNKDVYFSNGIWSSDGRLVIGGETAAEDYQLQVKGKMDTEKLSLEGVPIKEAVALWDEQNSGDIVFTEGNVGIGTIAPDSVYKLSVSGKVRSKEVVVEADWADFVFDKDYKLRSLREVEQYIQTHGHLPEIPSEEQVRKEGIGVGAIQAKLLQKIEELTLYSIQQRKQIEQLENLIEQQKQVLKKLEQQIQERNNDE